MANYFLAVDGKTTGPFPEDELRGKLQTGEINDESLVYAEDGGVTWVAIKDTPLTLSKIQLKSSSASTPPAQPGSASSGLQFDRAEFSQAKPGAVNCAVCKVSIADAYFNINGKNLCGVCKEKFAKINTGMGVGGFFKALVWGGAAALLGALVWSGVREVTGYELGIIAIGVGLLVGIAVRRGAGGLGGWVPQTLAMVLTYLAIVSTYVPPLMKVAMETKAEKPHATSKEHNPVPGDTSAVEAAGANADTTAAISASADEKKPGALAGLPRLLRWVIAFVVVLAIACALPFLAGAANIIGLVIIGIALYEAWKINRRAALEISGPYRIAPLGGGA